MQNQKGITLIEVLFSLILFSVISISLMRITDKSIQYNKKITNSVKNIKFSRNVIQIIKKDIQNIFYTQDINAFFHLQIKSNSVSSVSNHLQKSRYKPNNLTINDFVKTTIAPYLFTKEHYFGGLIGKKNTLYMHSLSYINTTEDKKYSNQNIVIYYLKPCKNIKINQKYSACLWRKFSPIIKQDLENLTDYTEFVLLENVHQFELSYYTIASNEWLQEWIIKYGQKRFLPSAIKVKLEFTNNKKQRVKKELDIPLYHQFILFGVK